MISTNNLWAEQKENILQKRFLLWEAGARFWEWKLSLETDHKRVRRRIWDMIL